MALDDETAGLIAAALALVDTVKSDAPEDGEQPPEPERWNDDEVVS